MSTTGFGPMAWIVVFRRLPPADPSEAFLIAPTMTAPILAVCSTAWGNVKSIILTSPAPSIEMLQAILSDLRPDVNEIVFLRAEEPWWNELEIALTRWRQASDVRRVVFDKEEGPLVVGTIKPVAYIGTQKVRSLLEGASIPKGILRESARRQAECWREVHPASLAPPTSLTDLYPSASTPATSTAPKLPVASRTPQPAKLPAPLMASAAPRLQATRTQQAFTRPLQFATPTSTAPRLLYAPRAATPSVIPPVVVRPPAPLHQLQPSTPVARPLEETHFVINAPRVQRKADPRWKKSAAETPSSSNAPSSSKSSSSNPAQRQRAPLDRRPPSRRDDSRKSDSRGPSSKVLPPNDLRRTLRQEPVDHAKASRNGPWDSSPIYTHTITNQRGDIIPCVGVPVDFQGNEAPVRAKQPKRSRRQEGKRRRNQQRRVRYRQSKRQDRDAAANEAGVQYDASGNSIAVNVGNPVAEAPARPAAVFDASPSAKPSAEKSVEMRNAEDSGSSYSDEDSDGYDSVDTDQEDQILASDVDSKPSSARVEASRDIVVKTKDRRTAPRDPQQPMELDSMAPIPPHPVASEPGKVAPATEPVGAVGGSVPRTEITQTVSVSPVPAPSAGRLHVQQTQTGSRVEGLLRPEAAAFVPTTQQVINAEPDVLITTVTRSESQQLATSSTPMLLSVENFPEQQQQLNPDAPVFIAQPPSVEIVPPPAIIHAVAPTRHGRRSIVGFLEDDAATNDWADVLFGE